ncbi:mannitol-1-phosphate 5-dehydrogenase [Spiroplasma helicoides]|uniref:Mannitol-1-phosphate 5-dehydrogenase n=1 Tax=Spiroplasma helicoides TaxID=216938 RepID=A0A1B3SKP7_9MOLU|nr:hypothetical protein [Spiroplasma helicoides]AOG60493.1 mannitol-1-phosphate 5-dehydrogenase [Spiroplasma helicoides]
MKVLHFGAGNIGRGFIAPILFNSKQIKELYFTDNNIDLISKLKETKEYNVIELDEKEKIVKVSGYNAVHSNDIDKELKLEEFDVLTTSIGSVNLKYIKDQVIKFIKAKESIKKPLIIMCCENGEKISSLFEKEVIESYKFDKKLIKFVDVMVDRIVPNEVSSDLSIKVEPYSSWVADERNWPSELEKITTIKYTENIDAEICKKVWMLNGGHASIAWKEWQLSKFKNKFINETLNNEIDNRLIIFLKRYLTEISNVVEFQFNYNREALDDFIDSVVSRFTNVHIKDEFDRVARNTLKKLQLDERILKPFQIAITNNIGCGYIKETIINALSYNNLDDPDCKLLEDLRRSHQDYKEFIASVIKDIDSETLNQIIN